MPGMPVSAPDEPLFLIDESLSRSVAKALELVGYNCDHIVTVFGKRGIKDPDIIAWCRDQGAVWVHVDDRARRQHRVQLETSGICTLWLYRKKGCMTAREQLRILAYVLPQFCREWNQKPSKRHYRASATSEYSRPALKPQSP